MKLYLVIAAVSAVASVAAVCGNPWDDDDDGTSGDGVPSDRRVELAPIDELELIIRESFPPQYAVRIVSGLPSGCAQFHSAELTSRESETFTIRVAAAPRACLRACGFRSAAARKRRAGGRFRADFALGWSRDRSQAGSKPSDLLV